VSEKFTVVNSTPAMAAHLENVQRLCFPTLAEAEIMTAAHYLAQLEVFPAGQFAALNEAGQVVAGSTDFITTVNFDHFEHRYLEAVGYNWLTRHQPDGDWLYGADIGVLPEYRRRGIATMLYEARRTLIRRLNLRGHVAGGLLSGYGAVKDRLTAEEYIAQVVDGQLFDPTLTVQLKRGFRVHGIIHNYVDDPTCDNKAAFIVWLNPDYHLMEDK
jgi:GNAT superfamily N-acetyltransferase